MMTKKLSLVLFLALVPALAGGCSHLMGRPTASDMSTGISEPFFDYAAQEWSQYYCPVHKHLFYFDHFADYRKCYKRAKKWHKKHKVPFFQGDPLLIVMGK